MRSVFLAALCYAVSCFAGIEDHYRKLDGFKICASFEPIDFIYLINLDQRPERWNRSADLLLPYGIIPQRFPGIYGWTLTPEELNDIGLQFQHGMWTGREHVMVFPPEKEGKPEFVFLDGSYYGKACFSGWTVKGTIGCTLAHLSALKDAYDSGYETIWILEDDFSLPEDPRSLALFIEELDAAVGKDGWDMLYTDPMALEVDRTKEIAPQIRWMWRPDMPFLNVDFLAQHQDVSPNLRKIGSRMRAHSIVYRRCGIKRILDFYRERNNFLPYDQEAALIPGIRMFETRRSVVTAYETNSDTRYRHFNQ